MIAVCQSDPWRSTTSFPGDAESPEAEATLPSLRINSALLTDANQLRVSYSHQLDPPPDSLRLTIRTPGETRPRASMSISKKPKSTETVLLPDSALADSHGTLLASLGGRGRWREDREPPGVDHPGEPTYLRTWGRIVFVQGQDRGHRRGAARIPRRTWQARRTGCGRRLSAALEHPVPRRKRRRSWAAKVPLEDS